MRMCRFKCVILAPFIQNIKHHRPHRALRYPCRRVHTTLHERGYFGQHKDTISAGYTKDCDVVTVMGFVLVRFPTKHQLIGTTVTGPNVQLTCSTIATNDFTQLFVSIIIFIAATPTVLEFCAALDPRPRQKAEVSDRSRILISTMLGARNLFAPNLPVTIVGHTMHAEPICTAAFPLVGLHYFCLPNVR